MRRPEPFTIDADYRVSLIRPVVARKSGAARFAFDFSLTNQVFDCTFPSEYS
jgi:hypothetical protein